jgi:hypothetical protein
MPVFVDNMFAAFGRMKMSHLIADSEDELFDYGRYHWCATEMAAGNARI